MKKRSLLSFLALAGILLVSCQNYDDQFDELNDEIARLRDELNQVDDINSKIEELQNDINSLESSVGNLPSGDDIDGIATSVAQLQSRLDALDEQLDGIQALVDQDPEVTQEDVDSIQEEIEILQEQVAQLLAQNSFAQGPISITNQAELAYVKSLGEFRNVRGNLTVDISDEELRDSITAVNTILGRIGVISGGNLSLTGHASHTLDASSITFVDGDLTVATKAADLSALASVSKMVNLSYAADYDFPTLTKTGSITLTDGTNVTNVNFPLVRATDNSKLSTSGSGAGVATFANATTVNIGDIEVNTLTANMADNVTLGYDGTASGQTSITAIKADATITTSIKNTGTHSYTIIAHSGATVNADDLTTAAAHLSITAKTVDLSALTSVHTLTLTNTTPVSLDALTTASGTLSFPNATNVSLAKLTTADEEVRAVAATTFSAPEFVPTAVVSLTAATNVTIGSATPTLLLAPAVTDLTEAKLADGIALDVSGYAALKNLNVTGVVATISGQGNQDNAVEANGSATLLSVTLAGSIGTVTLTGNTALESIETSGNIRDVVVDDNDDLTDITLGHTYVRGDFANTIQITGNADLEAVDMSAVQKIKTIDIRDNAKLASIEVGTQTALAEPITPINVTVLSNKLTGSYTAAQAGTQTTPYSSARAVQAHLYALRQLIEAYDDRTDNGTNGHTGTISFTLSFDSDGQTPAQTLIVRLDADTVAQAGADNIAGNADDQSDNAAAAVVRNGITVSGTGSGINTANELTMLQEN